MKKTLFICIGCFGLAGFSFGQQILFSQPMYRSARGSEVVRLQEFLKLSPDIYPEGLVTGYFGFLTEAAVKRFQTKYGIESIGIVGPKTRAKLNELFLVPPVVSKEIVNQEEKKEISLTPP